MYIVNTNGVNFVNIHKIYGIAFRSNITQLVCAKKKKKKHDTIGIEVELIGYQDAKVYNYYA